MAMGPDDYRRASNYRRSSAADMNASPPFDADVVAQGAPQSETAKPITGPATVTRSYDAFAMGMEWMTMLAQNMDSILQKEGGQDMRLYDAVLDDDNAFSMLMQRRDALVSRPWIVEPGDKDDPRSVQAADDLRDMLAAIGWDHVTRLMFMTVWFGYGVAEAIFEMKVHNGRTIVWLDEMLVGNRAWFAFTNAGELRLRTLDGVEGEILPPNKFWSFRTGNTHDFNFYGTGLAHWCYWPVWFKKNGLQFWALYLEKYGQPTTVGYFQPGASDDDVAKLLNTLMAVGRDSAVALPAPPSDPNGNMDLRPAMLEASRTGGADSYADFLTKMDEAVTRVIVGQTMTSRAAAGGIGSNQSDTQADRLLELVKADSDDMMGSFNKTIPVWLTLWNHGADVKPPTVFRQMDDEEDLNTVAERDEKLGRQGWQRTEDSFKQVYGEGYERKPEPTVDPATGLPVQTGAKPPRPANDKDKPGDKALAFAATDPRPCYVKRDLANIGELRRWAKEQGIELVDDPHVTILHSRTPVNWLEMGTAWGQDSKGQVTVEPGGVRLVDRLGPKAVVLHFVEDSFTWRHNEMIDRGASSDYDGYQPHVTLFKDPDQTFDVAAIKPYLGKLVFGPEYFEPIKDDAPGLPEGLAFTAEQVDRITAMANAMTERSDPIFTAFGEAIRDRLEAFAVDGTPATREELRIALLEAAERFPVEELGSALGNVLVATRAATSLNRESTVEA